MQRSPRAEPLTIAGKTFTAQDVDLIKHLLRSYPHLSRHELAATACELLQWQRPTGRLKTRECRDLLEMLAAREDLDLPPKRPGRPSGSATRVACIEHAPPVTLNGALCDILPITWVPVDTPTQHKQWRDLVAQYHYLGFTTPFGAHLRYLAYANGHPAPIACAQYSSPAWRMCPRDEWIGWSDSIRARHLQQLVNQSRFLILPWVAVKNLASHLLALSARRIFSDWNARFNVRPLLIETLVDPHRYQGTCYRAANWIPLGTTTGRGRMDRTHQRHDQAPKSIFVYPLHHAARERLRGAHDSLA
ncbi:MAG: Druantia anti-phage system protein DruA [Gammaproteobacteria bacterium]